MNEKESKQSMAYYFKLQYRMINRQLWAFGLAPWVAYILAGLLFFSFSFLLFHYVDRAAYLYVFVALTYLLRLSETGRNDFLKLINSHRVYRQIRVFENLLLSWPFYLFLLYQGAFLLAQVLLLGAVAVALIAFGKQIFWSIPTPFYRRPFEFVAGFRNTFMLCFAAYALTVIAISVGNFNLGIFAMMVIYLLCMSFYGRVEAQFYVWIYALGPKAFLWRKIKTAIGQSLLLGGPIILSLFLCWPEYYRVLIGFMLLGYVYLLGMILAKYSAFPGKMNFPQELLLGWGILLPPILLAVLPFFYSQSLNHLKEVLAQKS
ncbi:MAG: ABC transporter permease [Bacteroidota bacterium]